MKRICLLILSVVLILSFSACDTNQENNSENYLPINNSQTDIDTSKYIIQTPFYQIYEEDLQKYKYRITSGKDVLVEDIKTRSDLDVVFSKFNKENNLCMKFSCRGYLLLY